MARKKKAKKGRKKSGHKRARRTPKWTAAKRASYKREKRALIAKYNRK